MMSTLELLSRRKEGFVVINWADTVVYAHTNRIKSSTWRISNQLGSVLIVYQAHNRTTKLCFIYTLPNDERHNFL